MEQEILKSEVIFSNDKYKILKEVWEFDGELLDMKSAYPHKDEYIGMPDEAEYLCDKRGIIPEKSEERHCVCSIGFCEKEQKWYGWSHRAIFGFGVGDTLTIGDAGYIEGSEFCDTPAKTLEHAKELAKLFAAGVS